jgi:response regulator RpfG family c-di-GMP phosphodiesterase
MTNDGTRRSSFDIRHSEIRHRLRGDSPMKPSYAGSNEIEWPTLLCIDDDPQISEVIKLRLSQYEVNVISAYHGMHGFWLAMTNRPDLIVTDMRMPQGAGDYVVDCLRNNSDTRDIPVIVLTGQRDPKLESAMRKLGVEEYFTKPVQFDRLRNAMQKFIDLKERDWGHVGAVFESV